MMVKSSTPWGVLHKQSDAEQDRGAGPAATYTALCGSGPPPGTALYHPAAWPEARGYNIPTETAQEKMRLEQGQVLKQSKANN